MVIPRLNLQEKIKQQHKERLQAISNARYEFKKAAKSLIAATSELDKVYRSAIDFEDEEDSLSMSEVDDFCEDYKTQAKSRASEISDIEKNIEKLIKNYVHTFEKYGISMTIVEPKEESTKVFSPAKSTKGLEMGEAFNSTGGYREDYSSKPLTPEDLTRILHGKKTMKN